MRFKIWHLLLLMLIASVAINATIKRDVFPFATKADAAKANPFGLEFVQFIGDEVGPYRWVISYVEAMPSDKSSAAGFSMSVKYQLDGQAKNYQIPTDDDRQDRVEIFENPRGNQLLVILHERKRDP